MRQEEFERVYTVGRNRVRETGARREKDFPRPGIIVIRRKVDRRPGKSFSKKSLRKDRLDRF